VTVEQLDDGSGSSSESSGTEAKLIGKPTHSSGSTGWRPRSVFSSSWQQSSIIHWTVRLHTTWLQIYAVCLMCCPDDVWDRHSLTSSMSASRIVLLLETELSLWLVLDYRTVCHMTSSLVTHCHISVVDSKHFYLDSVILLFCFSSLPCGLCGFYLGHVKKILYNVML